MEFLQNHSQLIGILLMPLTYGFTGWFTNVVALKMTFYPLNFIGIPPYLGWQGIVPRKATGLALKAVQMLTERLVRVEEFFGKLDPEMIRKNFEPVILKEVPPAVDQMVNSLEDKYRNLINEEDRKKIVLLAEEEAVSKVKELTVLLKENANKVFNLKTVVLKNLTGKNVSIIVDIFQGVGKKEFKFIERSGWYFGAALGILQMGFWYLYPQWWTLPVQGVIVGYITNWLALYMIFRPLYPKKILFLSYHGLFLKRQEEVSREYSRMFATHVLTPKNIMEEVLYKRTARAVIEAIEDQTGKIIREKSGDTSSDLIEILDKETGKIQPKLMEEMIGMLSASSSTMEKLISRSMNVEESMFQKMKVLPPEEFEPILRTAFQEDEFILILIGSVLGALVGLMQAVYMIYLG